jgi:ElaB/YqjD/DUF883 family membrane-anchored ribosome-binding protein
MKTDETQKEMLRNLADDARALIAATADIAEAKVVEARKRVLAALEQSKGTYQDLRDSALEGAKAVDQAVHEYPYAALGIAFVAGAVLGCVLARRDRTDAARIFPATSDQIKKDVQCLRAALS